MHLIRRHDRADRFGQLLGIPELAPCPLCNHPGVAKSARGCIGQRQTERGDANNHVGLCGPPLLGQGIVDGKRSLIGFSRPIQNGGSNKLGCPRRAQIMLDSLRACEGSPSSD